MVAMLSIKFNTRCYISQPTNAQFRVLSVNSFEKDVCYMITATAAKHQLQSNQIGAQWISLCVVRCSLGMPKLLQDFATVAVNIKHYLTVTMLLILFKMMKAMLTGQRGLPSEPFCQLFNRAAGNKYHINPLKFTYTCMVCRGNHSLSECQQTSLPCTAKVSSS